VAEAICWNDLLEANVAQDATSEECEAKVEECNAYNYEGYGNVPK